VAGDETLGGAPAPVILAAVSVLDSGQRPDVARIKTIEISMLRARA
jgi:hypothetical protein